MRIWLITIGEPLPTDAGEERLLRAGILAEMLAKEGDDVVWWSSAFNHSLKSFRAHRDQTVPVAANYRLELLHGGGYKRNISLQRLRDHARLARHFLHRAELEAAPDVILCSMPPLALSRAATLYGETHNIPVILDIRDLWPDIFAESFPRGTRTLAKTGTWWMERLAKQACRSASAIWGHAPAFVEWGLQHAGRSKRRFDRDFPFGYQTTRPSPDAIEAAYAYWRDVGLVPGSEELVVSFVGTIGHQVELDAVLQAANILEGERGIRFVICGNGDRFASLHEQARHSANVLLAGWRQRAEIWTLLQMTSIGIAPYIRRADFLATIPNKVPEYLSAGLPVALSLGSGLVFDLIGHHECGFSYNGDASMLASALRELRHSPAKLAEMRARATALFNLSFRADRVYGDMIAVLREIADGPRNQQAEGGAGVKCAQK